MNHKDHVVGGTGLLTNTTDRPASDDSQSKGLPVHEKARLFDRVRDGVHGALEEGLAFLQKPCTRRALTRKIREILDSQ
jgi:hypothetical protein